jgi:cytidyltransferase-like protein
MSGINHLYDIYNKKGQEFVDQLFNTYVTVNEKMDGSAFTFERDKETGKFKFYRRDQRNPITFVDRTLMKYYEKPIQYIESLPPHILEQIPRGWRFGLEYFANTKPVEITYDTMPKNHLILSYVHEFGEDGKIKKTIQNKEELDNWADLLGIDRAPIIFQGYLTEDQKLQILDFLKTPFDQLVERFKTQSFVRFIIGTLNPDLKKSALNNDLDKDVEGIVFRFGDSSKDSEPVLAKMVDPVFTQMAKEKSIQQKENKPSDFLGITLLDVMNFILEEGIDSFKVEGENEDERYVSFMSDVFAKFLEENEDKYRGADFEEPEYLKREEFRLNKDLIEDRRVLKYVNEDDSFESLFKLMLNSFRKIKSRAGGIITKGMMEQMNLLIRDIKAYIEKPRKGKMNESFMSFSDFKKENSPVVEYLKEEDSETEADENPFYSYGEFITALETIDNSKSGVVAEKEGNKDLKDVNLLVGRFQPFHNGHLKMAKFLKEKNDFPSVAVIVYPGHNKSGKSPFKEDTIKKYMDGIVRDESEIADYIIVQRGLIGSAIVKLLEKGYKPHLIGAGEDRIDDYTKQLEYVKKSEIGEEMKDLKLIKTPRVTSATKVREAIADDNYQEVKRLVPKGVSVLYNTLKSEVNGTGVNESLSSEGYNWEFPISVNESISVSDLNADLKNLENYLLKLAPAGPFQEEELERLESIHDVLLKAKRIIQEFTSDELELKMEISNRLLGALVVAGSNSKSAKKTLKKKSTQVDSLIQQISDSTLSELTKRYTIGKRSGGTYVPTVTLDSILNQEGPKIHKIGNDLNGISQRDIKKIYNFDTSLGGGLQRRGKGESLFCLAFDASGNPNERGGDAKMNSGLEADKIVEIKSTNNAGIVPKTGGHISKEVEELIKEASDRFTVEELATARILKDPKTPIDKANKEAVKAKEELAKGRIQKNTSITLIDKLKDGTKESEDFIKYMENETGLKGLIAEDILPVILLLQVNYYSKSEGNFSMLGIFVENDDESPTDLLILNSEDDTKRFLTEKNIETLKAAGIAPKITASDRAEIYKSDDIYGTEGTPEPTKPIEITKPSDEETSKPEINNLKSEN